MPQTENLRWCSEYVCSKPSGFENEIYLCQFSFLKVTQPEYTPKHREKEYSELIDQVDAQVLNLSYFEENSEKTSILFLSKN